LVFLTPKLKKVPRIEAVCDAANNDSLVSCPARLLLFYCV